MAGRWWVVVEETRGMGDSREWKVSHTEQVEDAATADELAARLAREFMPAYPWSVRGRKVIRLRDQSYLALVEGRTSSFHLRVHSGELVHEE